MTTPAPSITIWIATRSPVPSMTGPPTPKIVVGAELIAFVIPVCRFRVHVKWFGGDVPPSSPPSFDRNAAIVPSALRAMPLNVVPGLGEPSGWTVTRSAQTHSHPDSNSAAASTATAALTERVPNDEIIGSPRTAQPQPGRVN